MGRKRRGGTGTRWVIVGLLVFMIVLPMAVVPSVASQDAQPIAQVGSEVDPDSVLMAVTLQRDGTATWNVEYRIRLNDANVTRAFESLQDDVDQDPDAFAGPFADRMAGTAAAAENATGRSMAIRNVTVSAERRQLPQEYGVISYRFDWVGFAAVDGDRIRAGPAIGGLFLDPETTLLISWPSGYEVVDVSPTPDDRRDTAVSWTGRLDFAAGEPLLVVAPASASGPTGGQTPTDGGGTDGRSDGDPNTVIVLIGIVVLIGIGAGVWWLIRGHETESRTEPVTEATAESHSGPPDELLSNEERVLSLLQDRGGRMKQQEVATALEWTDAKTSQVVGDLRESGAIESFRLGRENVLSLPDTSEPTRGENENDR